MVRIGLKYQLNKNVIVKIQIRMFFKFHTICPNNLSLRNEETLVNPPMDESQQLGR